MYKVLGPTHLYLYVFFFFLRVPLPTTQLVFALAHGSGVFLFERHPPSSTHTVTSSVLRGLLVFTAMF